MARGEQSELRKSGPETWRPQCVISVVGPGGVRPCAGARAGSSYVTLTTSL